MRTPSAILLLAAREREKQCACVDATAGPPTKLSNAEIGRERETRRGELCENCARIALSPLASKVTINPEEI